MTQGHDEPTGPSPHAVALGRSCLTILGCAWLAAALVATVSPSALAVAAGALTIGMAHLLLARFASRRVAVFLALFSP